MEIKVTKVFIILSLSILVLISLPSCGNPSEEIPFPVIEQVVTSTPIPIVFPTEYVKPTTSPYSCDWLRDIPFPMGDIKQYDGDVFVGTCKEIIFFGTRFYYFEKAK